LASVIDVDVFQIERVEADLDALAGQMGWGSKKWLCSRKVESRRTRRSTR